MRKTTVKLDSWQIAAASSLVEAAANGKPMPSWTFSDAAQKSLRSLLETLNVAADANATLPRMRRPAYGKLS